MLRKRQQEARSELLDDLRVIWRNRIEWLQFGLVLVVLGLLALLAPVLMGIEARAEAIRAEQDGKRRRPY